MTADTHNVSDRRNSRSEAEAVFDASRRQTAKSAQWLASGVSSNVRTGMVPTPLLFVRGDGAILYDIDGNALIDYYLAMSPMILGHNPVPTRRAAIEQLSRAILYGGQSHVEAAMAAALATLRDLADGSVINGIDKQGRRLMSAIASALKAATIPPTVTGFPQVFNVAFGPTVPGRNYRDLLAVDKARYIRFAHALVKRRVRVLERGTWFLSNCHDDDIIDRTIDAVEVAASEV